MEIDTREKTAPGWGGATGFMKDGDETHTEVFTPDGRFPDTQNYYHHWMLERENTVSNRKSGTGSPGNAPKSAFQESRWT